MTEWKVIPGYENYAVNNAGQVKSLRFNRLLKPSKNNSGYLYVNLVNNRVKKTTAIHRLVISLFGDQKINDNYIVDHKDNNKENNSILNLQWLSIKDNTLKAYGNYSKKEDIIKLFELGVHPKEISQKVGMHVTSVWQVIHKRS